MKRRLEGERRKMKRKIGEGGDDGDTKRGRKGRGRKEGRGGTRGEKREEGETTRRGKVYKDNVRCRKRSGK